MQTRMEHDALLGSEIANRLMHMLRTLLKCDGVAVQAADEHQLLQSVCDIFVHDGGFLMAEVGYAEPGAQKTIRSGLQAGDGILQVHNLVSATDDKDAAIEAIRTGQTYFRIPDSQNQSTPEPIREGTLKCGNTLVLSLPLKSDDQVFGALTLYADDPSQFEQANVKLLEEWSNLFSDAVIAARKAGLRAAITTAFSHEYSVRGVLHQCAEAIVHHLDAAFARIWILNNGEDVLQLQASAGLYTHLDGLHSRVPLGKLKIGWIAQEKLPHLTNDVIHDSRINDREWAKREGLVAFAGYPLLVEGRVIGVMAMFSKKLLSASTLETLASIADHIAQGVQRIRGEEELRRSEAYLREAQMLSLTGSFGWNVSSGELFWSEETYRIVGLDPISKPTVGQLLKRVHPEDVVIVKQSFDCARLQNTDLDFEHRFLMPDGKIKHVHVVAHAVKDEIGSLMYVGAVTDVTETKLAEEKIRQDERELRQIVEAIHQLIIVLSPDGRFLYANEAVLEYTGLAQEDIVAENFRERVIHPEDLESLSEKRKQAISNGVPFEAEYRVLRKDGQYRWFLTRLNPLRDERGEIIRWYATAIDIHDRKEAEEMIRKENLALREEIDKTSMFEEIVGTSKALQAVLSRVSRVAPTDSTVLIHGETGTGKELIARAIHKRSERSSRAFISVNCSAIPAPLIASELFGHEKGAFTGALQRRLGRFELADGGTIFLDEIGELPSEMQIALLRVLQEREFERVGGNQTIRVDVRVIAATNRDLQAAIVAGTFRSDLFYRLNVVPIGMPPLYERKEDIPLLMEYFIHRYASKAGKKIRSINKNTVELFQSYSWPGNVRELQNVIERSLIFCDTETFSVGQINMEECLPQTQYDAPEEKSLANELDDILDATQLENLERQNILKALNRCDWRISGKNGAAKLLGIPPTTLSSRMKTLKIQRLN